MHLFTAICLVILLLYMIKIGTYRYYWNRHPVSEPKSTSDEAGFSIVVPFRNETENLPGLVDALVNQEYPASLREIILVDDHSTDRSAAMAKEYANRYPGVRYLHNAPGDRGKKAAMSAGIREASHGYIITTDADCTMGRQWLSAFNGMILNRKPGMVIGLVDMAGTKGFFNTFQHIEFLSLVASGAGAAAGGRPIYCNGANLAFRKELADSFPDPMHRKAVSGDDTLFMHRIKRFGNQEIVLMKSMAGMVTTREAGSLAEFFNQRRRWASKWKYYSDRDTLYTACLVLAVSLLMLAFMVLLATGTNFWVYPLLLAGKSLVDYLFMADFLAFCRKKLPIVHFMASEVIYPLYILATFAGSIASRYSWKGRTYSGTA